MGKWQQQFSIGYFVVALILLFALQTFFASPRFETITYSQFKVLTKKGLLSNVVIGEKAIHGEIKAGRSQGGSGGRSREAFEGGE